MAKTFKGYVPTEQVTFTLESPDGSKSVTLRCKANVPGSKFLEFMGMADNNEDYGAMAKAVKEIIDEALADESLPVFWEFADNPANGVNLEMLAEISGWLSETFAGARPTEPQPV